MNDMEKVLEIVKDLLEIFVLTLTARQLIKSKKKSRKSKKRRK